MGFASDTFYGIQVERAVLASLQKKFPRAHLRKRLLDKGKDIVVPEKRISIEVKGDRQSLKTGNFFIEHHINGRESGINVTTANWWALWDGAELWYVPTAALKLECRLARTREHKSDGNTVEGYIISREIMQTIRKTSKDASGQ